MAGWGDNPLADVKPENYLGWSKAIEQPKPDQSKEALFKGIAEVGGEALKTGKFLVETQSTNEMEKAFDPVQAEHIANLQKTEEAIKASAVANPANPMGVGMGEGVGTSLLDTPKPIPSSIANLTPTMQKLESAKANGKLSETAYDMKLYTLLQDFRSKYPGFREHIDKEAHRITGKDIANDTIRNLVSDINSYVQNANAQKQHERNWIISHQGDFKDGPGMLAAYDSGSVPFVRVLQGANERIKTEADLKERRMVMEDAKLTDESRARLATKASDDYLGRRAAEHIDNIIIHTGAGTDERMTEVMGRVAKGQLPELSSAQWEAEGQKIIAAKNNYLAEMRAEGLKVDKNGDSIAKLMGRDKFEASLKEASLGFDSLYDAIKSKDHGMVATSANFIKAGESDVLKNVMTDPKIGPKVALLQVFQKIDPKLANTFVQSILGSKDYSEAEKTALIAQTAQILTPNTTPKPPGTRGSGAATSINGAMNDAKINEVGNKYYRFLAELPLKIAEGGTTIEARRELANKTFSPANRGMINNVQEDTVTKPGKYYIYSQYGSEKMVSEMQKLGGNYWTNYKNWMEETFSQDLFGRDMAALGNVQTGSIGTGGMKVGHVAWNGTGFELRSDEGKLINYPPITRLNMGISSLSNVYKAEGREPAGPILNMFIEHGFDPRLAEGMPKDMFMAIANSKLKKEGTELPKAQGLE